MKLYSAPISPFAARVRLSIYRKNLDIAIVPPPDGGLKGDAYLALNPMGQVPTLVLDDGFAIPESATILEYLEDRFPATSLRPDKAEDLARARLFLRLPDLYFLGAPRILLSVRNPGDRKPDVVASAMESLGRGLSYIDHFLDADSPWAAGGRASLGDCALIPILNAVALVERVYGRPDLIARHSKVAAYWRAAQIEPINARVIAEQMASVPKFGPPD